MFSARNDTSEPAAMKRAWHLFTDEVPPDPVRKRRARPVRPVQPPGIDRSPLRITRATEAAFANVMVQQRVQLFNNRDVHDTHIAVGSRAMLTPTIGQVPTCAALLMINATGGTPFPSVVVASSGTASRLSTTLPTSMRILPLQQISPADLLQLRAGTLVAHHPLRDEVPALLNALGLVNTVLYCFPGRSFLRQCMFQGTSPIRKAVHFEQQHVPLMTAHARVALPYVTVFSDPDMAFELNEAFASIARNAVHAGTPADIKASLTHRWAGNRPAWEQELDTRLHGPEECPVCYGDLGTARAVTECCSKCYCLGCIDRWVTGTPTCPSCRAPASYNTVHVVTDGAADIVDLTGIADPMNSADLTGLPGLAVSGDVSMQM